MASLRRRDAEKNEECCDSQLKSWTYKEYKVKVQDGFVVSTITAMNHYQLSSLFTSGVSIRVLEGIPLS